MGTAAHVNLRMIDLHPLQRLLAYAQGYQGRISQAMACSILNKIFDLAPPALIGAAVDVVVQRESSLLGQWGVADVTGQLVVLSVVSVLIWGLESLFEYAYDRLWRNLAQSVQNDLRVDAYSHLQELEMAFFEEHSTGGLMSILNDDINQLERFLDRGANEILQVTTSVLIIAATFFWVSPWVALLSMIPIPLILWGSLVFQRLLSPRYSEVREKVGLLNGRLANNLSGILTIKSFVTEAYERQQVANDSQAYRQSNRRAIALSAAYTPLIRMIILAAFIVLLLLGGMQAAAGRISVGNYSMIVFLIQRLLWPLTRLGETMDQYQRSMAAIVRVMNLLDTPIEIHSGHLSLPTSTHQRIRGEIVLEHVTFAYGQRLPAVQDLSLHIPAGKTTAIVGATGSGKSTLVKLLLRLYEIQAGTITLDGVDLRQLNLRDLRRAIGLVSQDVFLFHGTVRENILYGSFDAADAEMIAAAKVAEAHEFIVQLPQGYNTVIGERGQKLSGGQRQRIAIARAILKNPPILILDEATSAVDNETEAAIQKSLEQITINRTTIAIAHRLSTIRNANCIYVMEHGQLVERGTHEQLIEQQGIYAGFWRVQMGMK